MWFLCRNGVICALTLPWLTSILLFMLFLLPSGFHLLLKLCAYRKPVLIGVILMLLTAITGINTVIFYSTTIFELAGVEQQVSRAQLFPPLDCPSSCVNEYHFQEHVLTSSRGARQIMLLLRTTSLADFMYGAILVQS